jgi:hypothetical protein
MSLLSNNPLGDKKIAKQKDSNDAKVANKKIRNTYSMEKETSFLLDDLKLQFRRLLEENVSKTEIIEAAIIVASKQFERHGDDSEVVKEVLKMRRRKN